MHSFVTPEDNVIGTSDIFILNVLFDSVIYWLNYYIYKYIEVYFYKAWIHMNEKKQNTLHETLQIKTQK